MNGIIKHTKDIINLAGKLDWNVRNTNLDNSLDAIKKLRSKINIVQKFLNEHEEPDIK